MPGGNEHRKVNTDTGIFRAIIIEEVPKIVEQQIAPIKKDVDDLNIIVKGTPEDGYEFNVISFMRDMKRFVKIVTYILATALTAVIGTAVWIIMVGPKG